MSALAVLSALSDPGRLAMLGRIAAAGTAGCELTEAAAPRRPARRAQAGRAAHRGRARRGRRAAARRAGRGIRAALAELAPEEGDEAASPARVRALFRRGRIVEIPRAPELRTSLLRHLAERFVVGETYTEPAINAVLQEVHDDHVALRRYLVDAGLLERTDDGAAYRRAAP